ncbi:MAG: hypothetical protein IPK80_33810 [Nannocystis sp.]|nr:hypothetical protein [Nannocystis sp.]
MSSRSWMPRRLALLVAGAAWVSVSAAACQGGGVDDSGESEGSSSSTSSGSSGTGAETVDATTTEPETTGMKTDLPGMGNQCSLILQDCPQGQKCVPWNESGGIFPDGVRCVDEPSNADLIGEECMVTGGFGSGIDTCVKGALCFDLDNDAQGSCIEFCGGTPEKPTCGEPNEKCTVFFDPPVHLCFVKCDPLIQDCPIGQGCYMDEGMIGSEGFVCMPTVLSPNEDGDYRDLCYNQAGCAPGFACIYPENVPGCPYEYCCSPWCNLADNPEICGTLDAKMECIPWYPDGMATPGYEDVGICGLPL